MQKMTSKKKKEAEVQGGWLPPEQPQLPEPESQPAQPVEQKPTTDASSGNEISHFNNKAEWLALGAQLNTENTREWVAIGRWLHNGGQFFTKIRKKAKVTVTDDKKLFEAACSVLKTLGDRMLRDYRFVYEKTQESILLNGDRVFAFYKAIARLPHEDQMLWLAHGPDNAADFTRAVKAFKDLPVYKPGDGSGQLMLLNVDERKEQIAACVAEVEAENDERDHRRKMDKAAGIKFVPVPLNDAQVTALMDALAEQKGEMTVGELVAGMVQDKIAELEREHKASLSPEDELMRMKDAAQGKNYFSRSWPAAATGDEEMAP
jgi:hypothetical protein